MNKNEGASVGQCEAMVAPDLRKQVKDVITAFKHRCGRNGNFMRNGHKCCANHSQRLEPEWYQDVKGVVVTDSKHRVLLTVGAVYHVKVEFHSSEDCLLYNQKHKAVMLVKEGDLSRPGEYLCDFLNLYYGGAFIETTSTYYLKYLEVLQLIDITNPHS